MLKNLMKKMQIHCKETRDKLKCLKITIANKAKF